MWNIYWKVSIWATKTTTDRRIRSGRTYLTVALEWLFLFCFHISWFRAFAIRWSTRRVFSEDRSKNISVRRSEFYLTGPAERLTENFLFDNRYQQSYSSLSDFSCRTIGRLLCDKKLQSTSIFFMQLFGNKFVHDKENKRNFSTEAKSTESNRWTNNLLTNDLFLWGS